MSDGHHRDGATMPKSDAQRQWDMLSQAIQELAALRERVDANEQAIKSLEALHHADHKKLASCVDDRITPLEEAHERDLARMDPPEQQRQRGEPMPGLEPEKIARAEREFAEGKGVKLSDIKPTPEPGQRVTVREFRYVGRVIPLNRIKWSSFDIESSVWKPTGRSYTFDPDAPSVEPSEPRPDDSDYVHYYTPEEIQAMLNSGNPMPSKFVSLEQFEDAIDHPEKFSAALTVEQLAERGIWIVPMFNRDNTLREWGVARQGRIGVKLCKTYDAALRAAREAAEQQEVGRE